ncbi:MAG: TPM domain-containing protein [Burkholderiaceae bacterium]
MNKWVRFFKHRLFDETDAARALGVAAMKRIEERVQLSEQHHAGEICVCIEASLPMSYLWRNATARERAVTQFGKLRVWDTAGNNGVLIYLLLAEKRVEVLADRGLNDKVSTATWQALLNTLRVDFQGGHFESGLLKAVTEVDALLRLHCPLTDGQAAKNEMPDAPVRR